MIIRKIQIPYEASFTLLDSNYNVFVNVLIKNNDIFHIELFNECSCIRNDIDNQTSKKIIQRITGILFPKCKTTYVFYIENITIGSMTIDYVKNRIFFEMKMNHQWVDNYKTKTHILRLHASEPDNLSELLKQYCVDIDDKTQKLEKLKLDNSDVCVFLRTL